MHVAFLVHLSLLQSMDMVNAILEGYPKSKKELYVRINVFSSQLYCNPYEQCDLTRKDSALGIHNR